MSNVGVSHARLVDERKLSSSIVLYCPFPSKLHAEAAAVQVESVCWAERHGLAASDADAQRLARAKIAWLPASVFHDAPTDVLQLAADWTTLFCALDDHVDRLQQRLSPMLTSEYLSRLLECFNRAARAGDEAIERAFEDLARRMRALAPDAWVRRFAESLDTLFAGYVWEAINYWRRIKPTVDAYRSMREITIGLQPLFLIGELASRVELSSAELEHPALRRLTAGVCRCVGWANDVFTYAKEREGGEIHNMVLLLSDSCALDQSVRQVIELHDAQVRSFVDDEAALPLLFPDLSDDLHRYVAMLRAWIRGHLDWAYETGRYRPSAAQP
jgi:5-epi-alpha-selinene synthase